MAHRSLGRGVEVKVSDPIGAGPSHLDALAPAFVPRHSPIISGLVDDRVEVSVNNPSSQASYHELFPTPDEAYRANHHSADAVTPFISPAAPSRAINPLRASNRFSFANPSRASTPKQQSPFPSNVWRQSNLFSSWQSNLHGQQRAAQQRHRLKLKAQEKFHKGVKDFLPSLSPKLEQLFSATKSGGDDAERKELEDSIKVSAAQIYAAQCKDEKVTGRLLEEWCTGAVGFVPSQMPENALRCYGENINSMKWFDHQECKVPQAIRLFDRNKVDFAHMIETQMNIHCKQWKHSYGRLEDRIGVNEERRVIAASNMHIDDRCCAGGTAQMSFGPLTSFILAQGADSTGLGRWVWTLVGAEGGKKTVFITAYQPCDNKRRLQTVWRMHANYFEGLGISTNPRTLFVQHLLEFIASQKASGHEIILYIDANDNVYTGRLARALTNDDFNLKEQFLSVTGIEAPASHSTGSRPITGIFASAGIRFLSIFQSAHKAGLGDHRYTIYDVNAFSVLGLELHSGKRPVNRLLRTKVPRNVKCFNAEMESLVDRHRMFDKIWKIDDQATTLPESATANAFNKWDDELSEFMSGCQKRTCGKRYSGAHDASPTYKFWQSRVRLWRRAKAHKLEPLPDPRNLYRDLEKEGFPKPSEMSMEAVDACLCALEAKLEEVKAEAPFFRHTHLADRKAKAEARGDKDSVQQITRIIKKERVKKGWGICRAVHGKPRGRSVLSIQVKNADGSISTHSNQEAVEQHAAAELNPRFRLSASAPIFTSPLLEHVGLLGEKPAVKEILAGTFDFPPGTDLYTIAIMQAACRLFQHMSSEDISTLVSSKDFQQFWLKAREETASSYSNLHFGMYMANAQSDKLSAIHAVKLTLAAKLGIPLKRWHDALTVLLEKTFGCILIDKLRAICLLEADYNWLMKLIFAKRMMDNAKLKGVIPEEQFAKSGSRPQDACTVKTFFCDCARVLHETAAITGNDFKTAFDSMAQPLASVALQAWGVSLMMVKVMLSVLQTMHFFLRTGFGDASTSYGGSEDDKMGGLGQGNGAAPPAFQAVVTLLLMAYINMGHGVTIDPAISGTIFTIAAIIYVDDTDLLHWARSTGMTEEQFFDQVQRAILDWGHLAIASGGSLKADKCFWYLISFRFRNGIPYYKTLDELPSRQLVIPNPDGTLSPIELKTSDKATKTLGVFQDVEGTPDAQLEKMQQHGFDWADKAATKPLPRTLCRLSHDHQLVPRMKYGIECLLATPSELSEAMRKVMRRCLPYLCINRNYKTEFITLSRAYQGLELVDWPVENWRQIFLSCFRIGRQTVFLGSVFGRPTSCCRWRQALKAISSVSAFVILDI